MKSKIFNPFVYAIGLIALLLLQGCDKELESLLGLGAVENGTTVKQVDMVVVVPVHPSSLEYFDYCIIYSDNTGVENRDTIVGNVGGIIVDDWNVPDYANNTAPSKASPDNDIYWTKTFSYKSLPVVCRCETRLVPKVPKNTEVSFSYIIPKPYIFSRVIFNSHSYDSNVRPEIEGLEVVKIENMEVGTFMSAYGTYFVSACSVKEEYDGISCSSY